jgi:hypothetical protein
LLPFFRDFLDSIFNGNHAVRLRFPEALPIEVLDKNRL